MGYSGAGVVWVRRIGKPAGQGKDAGVRAKTLSTFNPESAGGARVSIKVAVRSYGPQGNEVNGFGGGEQRWSANLAHFLQSEGYEVLRCVEGQDAGCEVFFDASWERCMHSKARAHIHFSFSGANEGALKFPCPQSGKCNFANPYWETHLAAVEWAKQVPNINPVFVPQPYPDNLLPASAQIHGFERKDIFWGTKDMFHPNFGNQQRPDGREHVFIQNGLDTLRALIRFQKKVDFNMHFILKHHLDQAPPRLGIPGLLSQFRNTTYHAVTPWTAVINLLAVSKFNVPVGGLWGSAPESIFARSLPLLYPRNQFYFDMKILPRVEETTEDEIYETLDRLWFDRQAYCEIYDVLQEKFQDHRTEGLRKNLQLVYEKVGL